jgi:DinB superfamily
MKKNIFCFILLIALTPIVKSQTVQPLTLKQVLLNQLKTTHNKEEWFAPLNIAIEGITAEQANWKEKGADHSIAELTTHIIFWNQEELSKFLGQPGPKNSGDNNETFSSVTAESWPSTVKKADSVMINWENAIAAADEKKLEAWYEIIGHISTHNAYHTGQIVYIRKVQGSWNPAKGVK